MIYKNITVPAKQKKVQISDPQGSFDDPYFQ